MSQKRKSPCCTQKEHVAVALSLVLALKREVNRQSQDSELTLEQIITNCISPALLGALDNFFVCRLISFFVFVIVNCRANGENSISFSLRSPWKSCSASPFIVFKTNAIAFFRCELNNPLTEVAKPSPAPSLVFLRNAGS